MPETIDIVTVVDVVTTVRQGTGPAARVTLFDDNTVQSYGGDAPGNEITITCNYGDTLNFWFASLDPNVGITATKFVPSAGNVITVGYSNYHWTGTVNATSGTETFHYQFMIDGQPGIYWFDPYITVQS